MKLDKDSFKQIRNSLTELEKIREKAIRASRDVITLSKKVIYALHRSDLTGANLQVKLMERKVASLRKIGSSEEGIVSVAYQEYVEAICYFALLKTKMLPTPKALNVRIDYYLMGLADLSGELVRKAVALATKGKMETVVEIKEFLDDVNYEFLQFNLRDSELRKKADALRWNLKKIEDMLFACSVSGKR